MRDHFYIPSLYIKRCGNMTLVPTVASAKLDVRVVRKPGYKSAKISVRHSYITLVYSIMKDACDLDGAVMTGCQSDYLKAIATSFVAARCEGRVDALPSCLPWFSSDLSGRPET